MATAGKLTIPIYSVNARDHREIRPFGPLKSKSARSPTVGGILAKLAHAVGNFDDEYGEVQRCMARSCLVDLEKMAPPWRQMGRAVPDMLGWRPR